MAVTWIGHSTVLVQTQRLAILTDPIFSDYASPFPPLGPRRVRAPGIRFDDLPRIDVVLVSHNHYDHMDVPTLKRLWARDRPLIVTSLGNDTLLKSHGIPAVARDWGGQVAVRPGVSVVVERVHHWGSRWGTDRNRALWSGFTVRLPGGNLFYSGDTGFGDGSWANEAARTGPVRLALLPIGAYRPREMMADSHVDPGEAWTSSPGCAPGPRSAFIGAPSRCPNEAIDDPAPHPRRDPGRARASHRAASDDRGGRDLGGPALSAAWRQCGRFATPCATQHHQRRPAARARAPPQQGEPADREQAPASIRRRRARRHDPAGGQRRRRPGRRRRLAAPGEPSLQARPPPYRRLCPAAAERAFGPAGRVARGLVLDLELSSAAISST
jgi:L-ascorbate metabolism protein UlaG (beta-lactamase superfamily)